MKMIVNPQGGYTSPYCWKVFAGTKMYGTFLITNVSIRETMRDAGGDATRAFADITLHEVSDYQVESGIDLASRAAYSTRPPAQQQEQVTQEERDKKIDKAIALKFFDIAKSQLPAGASMQEIQNRAAQLMSEDAKNRGLRGTKSRVRLRRRT